MWLAWRQMINLPEYGEVHWSEIADTLKLSSQKRSQTENLQNRHPWMQMIRLEDTKFIEKRFFSFNFNHSPTLIGYLLG